MGARLKTGFEKVFQLGGLKYRMLVSIKAAIPSVRALELPDSDENIKKLESAIKEVTGQHIKI
ncbi:MAG: hypothetical protein HQK83_14580 [Fibrobacteria bacterium]|nr:hypothetical protein [Fibrobacteria bacterium]